MSETTLEAYNYGPSTVRIVYYSDYGTDSGNIDPTRYLFCRAKTEQLTLRYDIPRGNSSDTIGINSWKVNYNTPGEKLAEVSRTSGSIIDYVYEIDTRYTTHSLNVRVLGPGELEINMSVNSTFPPSGTIIGAIKFKSLGSYPNVLLTIYQK